MSPPGRPIVSAINGPLERVGGYIDGLLKTMVPIVRSYVRDTKNVLNKLGNIEIDKEWFLVGVDVASLYTSIPHHWGQKVVEFFLEKIYPQMAHQNKLVLHLFCRT